MNERIRELAEQASDTSDYGLECVTDKFLEHFAELIIRKCAFIVDDAVVHREPASTYVDKIKQYFGVEK